MANFVNITLEKMLIEQVSNGFIVTWRWIGTDDDHCKVFTEAEEVLEFVDGLFQESARQGNGRRC